MEQPVPLVVVGGCRLERLIGQGANGELYGGTEIRSGRRVAIKLLRRPLRGGADNAEARRRFGAEAALAQRLVHPDIVRVHGAGEEAGRMWIAMELLAGCDFVRYTRAARLLPEAVVLRVVERVARALAHAHAVGVLHRDVKPANVIVDWASDRVTLTDFGIARVAEGERTATGVLVGTPVCMAPEQLAGAEADASGDLYALGVMLFQLLAGRLPHDADSMGELLRRVATEPAPDLRALVPAIDPALAALVAALLAKRAAERPADAATVAARLAVLRAGLAERPAGGPKSRA